MGRRTVSLDDGSMRFRYFGKFQCGIAVFYYFLCGFRTFLTPPSLIDVGDCGLFLSLPCYDKVMKAKS